MLVSVVVPNYNEEKKLKNCLSSVSAQDYGRFEVIVVDDGSEDSSLAICSEYAAKDARVRIIRQAHAGVSAARNRGMLEATGELLCFLDSDDRMCPSFLSQMVSCFEDEAVDLAVCGYIRLNGEHDRENVLFQRFDKGRISRIRADRTGRMMEEEGSLFNVVWNKLFKRNVIARHGIRFLEHLDYGEDLLFVLDYLKHAGEIAVNNRALYCYRSSCTGLAGRYREDFFVILDFLYGQKFRFWRSVCLEEPDYVMARYVRYYLLKIRYYAHHYHAAAGFRQYIKSPQLKEVARHLHEKRKMDGLLCFFIVHDFGLLAVGYLTLKRSGIQEEGGADAHREIC